MKNKLLSLITAGLMLCGISRIDAMEKQHSDLVQRGDAMLFNIDARKPAIDNDFDFDMNEFYNPNEDHNAASERSVKKAKIADDIIVNFDIFNLQDPSKWVANPPLVVPDNVLTPPTPNNNNNNPKSKINWSISNGKHNRPAKKAKLTVKNDMFNLSDPSKWTKVLTPPTPNNNNSNHEPTIKWSINNDHAKNKALTCTVAGCNKSFNVRSTLYLHINKEHTKAKKYPCHFCNAFPEKVKSLELIGKDYFSANFLKHLRSHFQPYFCDIGHCSKIYSEREQLKIHQENIHGITNNEAARGNNNTYPCRVCGMEGLTDLPSHKAECCALLQCALIKIGVPPSDDNLKKIGFNDDNYSSEFKCSMCNEAFNNNIGLSHHMTVKHPVTPSPLQTSNTALVSPSPTALAPNNNTNQSDDRITNAHDDPSHLPHFETPLLQPAALQPKKAPEPFAYYVRKNTQYETEWTKL
jgi:hypothetical protein